MWKKSAGRLVQVSDPSRVKFRTNISKALLEELNKIAKENDTYVNYLLENGLLNVLRQNSVTFNKETRPKDRVQYKTAYDKELLDKAREFAKKHKLYLNDLIEYSARFINLEDVKTKDYKHRIE